MVSDGETVVIGGLICDRYTDDENKVPSSETSPGWAGCSRRTSRQLRKIEPPVFLTPHIIRSAETSSVETIRKRLEFENQRRREVRHRSGARRSTTRTKSSRISVGTLPPRDALRQHAAEYPLSRMRRASKRIAGPPPRAMRRSAAEQRWPNAPTTGQRRDLPRREQGDGDAHARCSTPATTATWSRATSRRHDHLRRSGRSLRRPLGRRRRGGDSCDAGLRLSRPSS